MNQLQIRAMEEFFRAPSKGNRPSGIHAQKMALKIDNGKQVGRQGEQLFEVFPAVIRCQYSGSG